MAATTLSLSSSSLCALRLTTLPFGYAGYLHRLYNGSKESYKSPLGLVAPGSDCDNNIYCLVSRHGEYPIGAFTFFWKLALGVTDC